jgi:hypothetical protein
MGLPSGVYLPLATAAAAPSAGYRLVVGLLPSEARTLSTLNKVCVRECVCVSVCECVCVCARARVCL